MRTLLIAMVGLGVAGLGVAQAELIGINVNGVMCIVDPDTSDTQVGLGTDQFGTYSLARGPTGELLSVNENQQLVTFPDRGGPASILLQLAV